MHLFAGKDALRLDKLEGVCSIKGGRRLLFDLEDIDTHLLSLKYDTSLSETIANKIIEEYHGEAIIPDGHTDARQARESGRKTTREIAG